MYVLCEEKINIHVSLKYMYMIACVPRPIKRLIIQKTIVRINVN